MKSCDKMVNSLLKRREKYIAGQKRKRKVLTRTVISMCCVCLVALLGFGMWQSGVFNTTPPAASNDSINIGETDYTSPDELNNGTNIEQTQGFVQIINADYREYEDIADMCDNADTIILGKVIDSREELLNISDGSEECIQPYIIYTVKVEEFYKGEPGEIYEFKMLGGKMDDTSYKLEGAVYPECGCSYLIMTEEYGDSYASPLNLDQALIECDLAATSINIPNMGNITMDEIRNHCYAEK